MDMQSLYIHHLNSDDLKAELVDYLVDDNVTFFSEPDEKTKSEHDAADQYASYGRPYFTLTPVEITGRESNRETSDTDPQAQCTKPKLPPAGLLPVQAYPNSQNYLFWFQLDSVNLDKEILSRNSLCITYARNRFLCAILGLLMFFHFLLFHGPTVRWVSKALKLTLGVYALPPAILWFAGNFVTLAVLGLVARYAWLMVQRMRRIRQMKPLVLPDDILKELDLKGRAFQRLFISEEGLRPFYFPQAFPATSTLDALGIENPYGQTMDQTSGLFNTPLNSRNVGFFNSLFSSQKPPPAFSFGPGPATAALPSTRYEWEAPEQPFSWFHWHNNNRLAQQQMQQPVPRLPRYMQKDYVEQQRQQHAAAYYDSFNESWQQQRQKQSMFANNTPLSSDSRGLYNRGYNLQDSNLLYPSPMQASFRSASSSPLAGDTYNIADTSMMSTSSAASSASRRSRTPSCLLHEHDQFDSVDRESVYNTYGYPAVERAFESLKQVTSASPAVFYSSQFLARLLAGNRTYNTSSQFDVPQTLDAIVQPKRAATATPFGFLQHRRRKQSDKQPFGSNAMDIADNNNLTLNGAVLMPDDIWLRLGVTPTQVYTFTQNLKHWLLITMVRPLDALVEESDRLLAAATEANQVQTNFFGVDAFNAKNAGAISIRANPDILALRQALRARPNELRVLNNLIPFLEAFGDARQPTTVAGSMEIIKSSLQRINVLSNASGIMNNYTWDASGMRSSSPFDNTASINTQQRSSLLQTYAGNIISPAMSLWSMHKAVAPTNIAAVDDGTVLFHTFRTFFDVIMNADPRTTRPFSFHYVLSSDAEPTATSRLPFPMLYRDNSSSTAGSSVSSNFQVFYEGKFLQPERGRNNLFHAILLFLILLRNRFEDGRGAVWIGYAGSHIFDVFRPDYREFMESHLTSV